VLDQEELFAVGEGGGLRRHAVVCAAPQREVQLARLARYPPLREVLYQGLDGFSGQGASEELRLAVEVPLRLIEVLPEPVVLAGHFVAELGQVMLDVPVAHVPQERPPRVRAGPSDEVLE
jgi:hypothetical protein